MRMAPDAWTLDDGPHSAVVMTSRARVARNLAGFPFVNRATESQRAEIVGLTRQVITSPGTTPRFEWCDLARMTDRERRLLVERHLISAAHADCDIERAVALSEDESLSIMVNEEDHLRIQCLGSGLCLGALWNRVSQLDDALSTRIAFAFNRRWGYLTACPTNVGTGVRFSVMLHLPALRLTDEIERVRRAAQDLHLAVRGYYGEGSESAGDFYQVSNQVTLGRCEEELLEELEQKIVPRIIEYELEAREMIERRSPVLLDDRVHRALGLLRVARLLGTEEAMKLLSRVRLGIHVGRITDVPAEVVNRLFLEIQPAHLHARTGGSAEPDALREQRARVVRVALGAS